MPLVSIYSRNGQNACCANSVLRVNHDKLICREPCERILSCNHRCQRVCGENCVCSCANFTGAYAHDEFPSGDARNGIDYDPTRVAPFITADERRAGAAVGSRGGHEDLEQYGRGRGYRRGIGYDGPGRGGASRNVEESDFVRPGDGQIHRWTVFDAHQDDKQKLREAQEQSKSVDALVPMLNGTTLAIHDTFRSVTLDKHGRRNIGGEVESREISTPSPKKGSSDLLSFEDDVEMAALTTRTVSPTTLLPNPTAFGFLPYPQPRQQPQSSARAPTSAPVTTSREVEGAEWESGSQADTASVLDGDANGYGKEGDDLISL